MTVPGLSATGNEARPDAPPTDHAFPPPAGESSPDGGCSPLAGKKHYPVFVDESAILYERIYVSAGHRGVQLRLAPDDLLRAAEGTYAAIARY